MHKYIIYYFGGDLITDRDQQQAHLVKYQSWLDSLSEHLISATNPLKNNQRILPDRSLNSSTSGLMGFSIIQAENQQQAIQLASQCPFLDINGQLEVAQLVDTSQSNN